MKNFQTATDKSGEFQLKKLFVCLLSVIIIATCFSACTVTPDTNYKNGTIKIVTTIFPIYDWAKNVVGSNAQVIYLDESGVDLHSFEPTANDIIALSDADLFVCIGGASDKWVDNAVSSSSNSDLKVIKLMEETGFFEEETVEGMENEVHDHEHNDMDIIEYDEHIWLSLKKAQIAVNSISDTLCSIDNKNADIYRNNANKYIEELKELDRKYESAISSNENKTLLFADRFPFRYMVEDYGLDYYAAFPGCSAESEASFETLTFLIEKTKELNLKNIIMLESSDGKIASTISSETGATILTLNSCQSVKREDANKGLTYISIMESNLKVLTEALG